MHYTIRGNSVYADEGYIFILKTDGSPLGRCMDIELLDLCECVPEPEPEEPEEDDDNGEFSVSV